MAINLMHMTPTFPHQKVQAVFSVLNDKGLHTRPSAELVKCATNFESTIYLSYKNNKINAKSMLEILMLAAERGAKILVEADGPDAENAVDTILKLVHARFYVNY